MEEKDDTVNQEGPSKTGRKKLYRREELELMTTHQLREICRNEKIIPGIINPMDKEGLVHVIMRYRGMREQLIIRESTEEGNTEREQQRLGRLKDLFAKTTFRFRQNDRLQVASKIIVHSGLSLGYYDDISIPYQSELDGTNALVVSGGTKICGLFYLRSFGSRKDRLYLLRDPGVSCEESPVKNYELYCFQQPESELLHHIYFGLADTLPAAMDACKTALIDLEVQKPVNLRMPMAIDFGSTNTTAGVYLDTFYFEEAGREAYLKGMEADSIQYTAFYERQPDNGAGEILAEKRMLPSVVGILSIKDNRPEFVFGYEAVRLANLSYIDEGFCHFYDIKRWIGDYEKEEEVTDRQGRRGLVRRKTILKAFFGYVIRETENRFKCKVGQVHVSCPVKQKFLFQKLFADILPEQILPATETVDEGVAVLYNTISNMLEGKKLEENRPHQALIMDCGGGTTDLCACRFLIRDNRIAYRIEVETAYENGDTDFGGNNLTYRIMQLLKVAAAKAMGYGRLPETETKAIGYGRLPKTEIKTVGYGRLPETETKTSGCGRLPAVEEIMAGLDRDIFRLVDRQGTGELYRQLEEAYEEAENFLPTRFRNYESHSRTDYYKVKNNFYFFFFLAEQIKKSFYEKAGVAKVIVSSSPPAAEHDGGPGKYGAAERYVHPEPEKRTVHESSIEWIRADKWKVSVKKVSGYGGQLLGEGQEELQTVKEFPVLTFELFAVELLLKGDIYNIVSKFINPLYEKDQIREFSFFKLTGQSCKIGLFREALKEFIPGKMIRFKRRDHELPGESELKLTCVDGALKYLRDKRLGYAEVIIRSEKPVLPYTVTAFTHSGREVELVNGFLRRDETRTISRNLDFVTLQLYLKDTEGKVRYSFHYDCRPDTFETVVYEQIEEKYGAHIQQKETDSIVDREVKFFIWKRFEEWGYVIVPVYRLEERLYLGKEQFYPFENEGWVQNFFDGLK